MEDTLPARGPLAVGVVVTCILVSTTHFSEVRIKSPHGVDLVRRVQDS